MNIAFDVAKITRILKMHGQDFTFERQVLDIFNEPTSQAEYIDIRGLFHQTRDWISVSVSDGTTSRSKPQPQILTLIDENSSKLRLGDQLSYCGKVYKVSGVDNLSNLNIAYDISLEMVDDGS